MLLSYLAGVAVSITLAAQLLGAGWLPAEQSALLAVDMGMALCVLLFLWHIAACFGLPEDGMNFAFLPYFERHWRLFVIAASYAAGLFLPNILIWFGPWGVEVAGTFRYSPVYDVVTFYALLSVLPLMMVFVVSVETNFYQRYAVYFSHITRKGNFRQIEDARKDLLHVLWFELRHAAELQLVFTLVFLALGSYILSRAGITYEQVFLASNLVLGVLGLCWWGEQSYGFTFFLAAAASFVVAAWRLDHFASRINYLVFCSQPVFYQPPHGLLTRLAMRLYGERYVDLERERREEP